MSIFPYPESTSQAWPSLRDQGKVEARLGSHREGGGRLPVSDWGGLAGMQSCLL